MSDKTNALTPVKEAELALLDLSVSADVAAARLLALPLKQRRLAIAGRFGDALSAEKPTEMVGAAEKFGRRVEGVLDEMPEEARKETIRAMIEGDEEGNDTEVVLSMIRGRSGDLSTVAKYLDPDLVEMLYEQDPDMGNPETMASRIVPLTWTLLIDNSAPEPVARYFVYTPSAARIRDELARIAANGDEDALHILSRLLEMEARIREEDEAGRD